jgi:hypothetical protein
MLASNCFSQKVKISREINVKNELAYDILPNVGDNLLFYRERVDEYFIDVFTQDLEFQRTQEITFEKKKVNIIYNVAYDSSFHIIYSYKEYDTFYIKMKSFDRFINAIDTNTVFKTADNDVPIGIKSELSEDKSKILLFGRIRKNLAVLVYDIKNLRLLNHEVHEFRDVDLREDFRKILVTNKGFVFILFEKNNTDYSREDHELLIYKIYNNSQNSIHRIASPNMLNTGLEMEFHNKTEALTIAGMAGKHENTATAYFVYKRNILQFESLDTLDFLPFEDELFKKINPNSKNKTLYEFKFTNMRFRQDGGVLLFGELIKEFYRNNSNFPTIADNGYFPSRGFTDYFNEDMIVFNVNPDGSTFWWNVLFKKQYSQDDRGVFSSFFLFNTPSRYRVVYNDEIKKSNTVSEYEIDPLGNCRRNTVLNTDYQNLKLRFTSAIQTSNTEFVVPSEKTNKINLVKISY